MVGVNTGRWPLGGVVAGIVIGLVEMIPASIVGAWVYREDRVDFRSSRWRHRLFGCE